MESAETEIIEYKGKEALRIKGAPGERIVYMKDFEFIDGNIELDIAAIPYYTGLVFRVRSGDVYEGIYFRPQNSRQKDPVRRGHTVQYISNPIYTWYYLRETAPEKYESAVDVPPDAWFHVKVVVAGVKAEVFVNDAKSPCLVIEDLKHGISQGSVGVWCGNTSGGTFANLTVTPIGIPEEWPESPAKKPFQEFAIFEKLIQGINYVVPIKRKTIKLDPKIYNEYVGRYKLNEEVTVMVTKEDSRLFVQATGQAKIEIFPENIDEFFLKVADIQISFIRSEGGRVTELIIHQGGQNTPAKKIE